MYVNRNPKQLEPFYCSISTVLTVSFKPCCAFNAHHPQTSSVTFNHRSYLTSASTLQLNTSSTTTYTAHIYLSLVARAAFVQLLTLYSAMQHLQPHLDCLTSTMFRVTECWALCWVLSVTCIRQRLIQTPTRSPLSQRLLTCFTIHYSYKNKSF